MKQCQCSSNKLGVHCYQCEDEELELQNRVPKMAKKMCKKNIERGSKMKRYEIEYRLHYNRFSFDTCCHVFEGKNKTDAIKNYNRETGVPVSRIVSIELITD